MRERENKNITQRQRETETDRETEMETDRERERIQKTLHRERERVVKDRSAAPVRAQSLCLYKTISTECLYGFSATLSQSWGRVEECNAPCRRHARVTRCLARVAAAVKPDPRMRCGMSSASCTLLPSLEI